MTIIDRLKLELSNKNYFSDAEYAIFLQENGFENVTAEYNFINDKRNMLCSVHDVLTALSNDIDSYRKIETEFITTSEAMTFLTKRIDNLKREIASLSRAENPQQSQFMAIYHN